MSQKGREFFELREAFEVLSGLIASNSGIRVAGQTVRLAPGADVPDALRTRLEEVRAMVREIMAGAGQRSSVSNRHEVVLSALACGADGQRHIEICAISVRGRGAIERTLSVSTAEADWAGRLAAFVDWNDVEAIIPAAEGNNQRALIGIVLSMAGIGRGRMAMIEADLPEEVDEAAQMIRGADWLKAGLPRFMSAASEALWYLMRIRSVHARMIRSRKQGYYTSMAVAALAAAGRSEADMAKVLRMDPATVRRLLPQARAVKPARLADIGPSFADLDVLEEAQRAACAARVWRGAAIYANIQASRNRIARLARERIGAGEDLVSIAADLSVPRRDLVRALSVRADAAESEVARFRAAVLDPELLCELGT